MEFVSLQIEGVFGLIQQSKLDSRGTLTRVWDSKSLPSNFNLIQASVVFNPTEGTLRGLHYQSEPYSENKVIQCISGRVFDVVVDLRKDSSTFGCHLELVIGPFEDFQGIFVPAGCAHGYLTLEINSDLIYFMDNEYSLNHSEGLLWNDTKLSIDWPHEPVLISERDSKWPQII
jgi:dTDP-4-dehydrorhamnose 3,5-epimerase